MKVIVAILLAMDVLYIVFRIYWIFLPQIWAWSAFSYWLVFEGGIYISIYEIMGFITLVTPALIIFAISLLILRKINKQEGISKITVTGMLVLLIGGFMILKQFSPFKDYFITLGLIIGPIGVIISIVGYIIDWHVKSAQLCNLDFLGILFIYTGIGFCLYFFIYNLFEFYGFFSFDIYSFILFRISFWFVGPLLLLIGMTLWVIGNSK